MIDPKQAEMTRLGRASLAPLLVGAAGVWLANLIGRSGMAYDLGEITLIYAGLLAAYLAGVGAGGILRTPESKESFLPGLIAALVAWLAIWPVGALSLPINDIMRHFMIIGVFVYLLLRDLRGVEQGQLPAWYGALRRRLTFWTLFALALLLLRLIAR
jgi:hypothetical protein